jgi:large subunit ribosomal protein L29
MKDELAKLRNMSPAELLKEEIERREEIWKLRIQMTTGQLQDPHKIRMVRRSLARLLTVRHEVELQAQRGNQ